MVSGVDVLKPPAMNLQTREGLFIIEQIDARTVEKHALAASCKIPSPLEPKSCWRSTGSRRYQRRPLRRSNGVPRRDSTQLYRGPRGRAASSRPRACSETGSVSEPGREPQNHPVAPRLLSGTGGDRPGDQGTGRGGLRRQRGDVCRRDAHVHAGRRRLGQIQQGVTRLAARRHRRRRQDRQVHHLHRQTAASAHPAAARRPPGRRRDQHPRPLCLPRHQRRRRGR